MRRAPILMLTLLASAHALANGCIGVVAPPSVRSSIEPPALEYRNVSYQTLQNKQVNGLAYQMQQVLPYGAKFVTQGLTETKQTAVTEILPSLARYKGGWCVSPQVHVRLTRREILINMPNWYPSNSCEYRAVLEHEKQHARIFLTVSQNIVAAETKHFQQELAMFYGWTPSKEAAVKWASGLNEAMNNRVSDRLKYIDQMQEQFDSPEEYARMKNLCSGWK